MRLIQILMVMLSLLTASGVRAEDAPGPVVVELFTSQGCSSCPPADDFLQELAKRQGVIALAFHVDYWDYLGWQDTFAKSEYTARQKAYAHVSDRSHIGRRLRGVFTPEIVVQGTDSLVGSSRQSVQARIAAHAVTPAPVTVELSRPEPGRLVVRLTPRLPDVGAALVKLASFLPSATVEIERGENAGLQVDYANVVTSMKILAEWDGAAPLDLTVAGTQGPVAVLVQTGTAGPILGAARID